MQLFCRPRRRSGSSIVVIDGDDLKPCLPDDYISGQHYRQSFTSTGNSAISSDNQPEIDQEMLTMLSLNQDNGNNGVQTKCNYISNEIFNYINFIMMKPYLLSYLLALANNRSPS